MKKTDQFRIGPQGRVFVNQGVTFCLLGILLKCGLPHGIEPDLSRKVGEQALPYVVFFTPVVLGLLTIICLKKIPQRFAFWSGVIGWVLGLILVYTYFWVGPGAYPR